MRRSIEDNSGQADELERSSWPEPQVIRAALDAIVLQSLRPVCIGLSALYLIFAISHRLFLPPVAAAKMSMVAAGSTLLLLALYFVLRHYAIPSRWAHGIGACIAGVILLNSLLHLYLLSEPEQTTNVALLVIGVGCFFLSARWLALVLGLALGGWAGIFLIENSSPDWRHYGFMLFAATVISVLIHTVRFRALEQLERMHIRDVRRKSELEAAVRATQLSEERFRQLSEATFEGVAVHENGQLIDANQALASMFGYTLSEVVGINALNLIAPESQALVMKNIQSKDGKSFEATGLRKDGATFSIEICGKAIEQQGRWLNVMAIRDISERRQAEKERAQLIHEQAARAEAEAANRTKDEFLATISHELRTPLTSIRGWSHMLRSGQVPDDLLERGLEIIERKAITQGQLINDLLDVSRIITGKLRLEARLVEVTSLVEMAVDGVRPLADEKSIRLQTSLDATRTPVLGDPERLQQVMWNLLSNAIKFTPEGGLVEVKLAQTDSHAEITISDTGIGIDMNFLPHVFDRFRQADSSSTRAYGGLGIGLAIVKHLVELHSGTVKVESGGSGQGTTFTVKLPLVVADVPQVSTPDGVAETSTPQALGSGHSISEEKPEIKGVRVLVVDDDEDTCKMLDMVLRKRGAEVKVACTAQQAFSALEWEPDVLVSDIGMPGEDGYELISKVRRCGLERGRQIPAIALTAYARSEDRLRALSAGYQIHLPKPIEPDELISAIASLARRTEKV
ncbi:MAG TPA: ATP-binding protein [Pyrinomonadaceae bacterium]|jgi:PAS domain S-box-containing protein